jgi:Holliday junction resolvase/AAA+ ATPase superfamily predicted ATPase
VGKTSLLRHFVAHIDTPEVILFEVDCWENRPTPKTFFQDYLVQTIDAFLRRHCADRFSGSVRASLSREPRLLTTLADLRGLGLTALNEATEWLLELRQNGASDALFASVIDLPETLAQETQTYFVAILDEFQELQDLNHFKAIRENLGDIFAFFRARWQHHQRVNYVVSGSRITLLKELLTQGRRPFFQHFKLLEIGPFQETDAQGLLRDLSQRAGRPIPPPLIGRLIDLVGTNPFYLQILGSELCAQEILDEDAFKVVLQEALFNETGKLSLYFQDLAGRAVGRSASLEQTLIALAREPGRLTEVARRLGIGAGTLKSWIDRVADFITVEQGIYRIADPALRLWLSRKSDLGPVLPPLVLGDEAEKAVAQRLAALGFELVYQSRASRGAFDLLAILQAREVGVQVKKASLPFYLDREELQRMRHWAKQLEWIPLLALVVDDAVYFYDARQLRVRGESVRIDERTRRVENVLALVLDGNRGK